MKTILGFGNLLLLTANLSTLGTVAYRSEFWKSEPERLDRSTLGSFQEHLDLSAAQAREIAAQREAFTSDWEAIEAELAASREKLLNAIRDEHTSPSQIWPLIDDIAALQTGLEKQAARQLLQERNLLSSEQRERYISHVETRMRQGCGCMQGYRGGRGAALDRGEPGEPLRRGRGGKRRGGRQWR
jgi:hypothetical protein